jgi:hypothetical protein
MYDISPNRDQEKPIFLNDLLQMRMIEEQFPGQQILETVFHTYNITRFSRYSINTLKRLFDSKDTPTGKPIFPIFMSKRDYN